MKPFNPTIKQEWKYVVLLEPKELELSGRQRVKEIAWKELVTIIPVEFRHKIKEEYIFLSLFELQLACTFKPLVKG